MKRSVILLFFIILCCQACVYAQAEASDPQKLFYEGCSLYEKGDYQKAAETYLKVLDSGIESGNLYYNIGNAFLKMGKAAYAILSYEKANRFIPGDGDLKSNLEFAYSMVEAGVPPASGNMVTHLINRPFRELNLRGFTHLVALTYVLMTGLAIFFIANPIAARRFAFVGLVFLAAFIVMLAAYGMRFYDEEIVHHGIVMQKLVEARYEPIDKSAVYFTAREGERVAVMKTRGAWRQIRKSDGKAGWVKKESVEQI